MVKLLEILRNLIDILLYIVLVTIVTAILIFLQLFISKTVGGAAR